MPKDPKSKKVSKAKAAKNTVDVEIAAEVVDDSKPKLKKGKKYYYKVSAVKVGNGVKARSNLSSYRGKKL